MSIFACENCGTICVDTPTGYVTGCEHYPEGLDTYRPVLTKRLTLEVSLEMAWCQGWDCGKYGQNDINSNLSLFATPELAFAWEAGNRAALWRCVSDEGKEGTGNDFTR